MAETVKILSPQKKVLLSDSNAGCPMAEQMDKDLILQLKEMYPDYKVVAYINTTSELKTVCDVCVTSSSAVKIVKKLDSDKIPRIFRGYPIMLVYIGVISLAFYALAGYTVDF